MEAALQVEGTSIRTPSYYSSGVGGIRGSGTAGRGGWKVLPLGLSLRHCWHSSAIPHMPGIPHPPTRDLLFFLNNSFSKDSCVRGRVLNRRIITISCYSVFGAFREKDDGPLL